MRSYRNVSVATTEMVGELLGAGSSVEVRGRSTREVVARHTRLNRPLERHLFVPGRNNDVFAQVAETMWVLAGRDDVAWLERYLPRAPQFSDDGKTWRAAYGPRLRNWGGRDQIDEVRNLLIDDPASRRAVISLFDPARDIVHAKDVPCTNWLGWLIRDGRLHMNVVLRSNDVIWGFSGVNSFEWSVLQEMLASWLGVEVGPADFFAMSLHLYDEHLDRAARIAEAAHGATPYDHGIRHAAFGTSWPEFGAKLSRWFDLEAAISAEPDRPIGSLGRLDDPFLDGALSLVHLRWASEFWSDERLTQELGSLPPTDQVAAAYQQLGRHRPRLLESIAQPEIAAFAAAVANGKGERVGNVGAAIKRLHGEKNRAYGASWKRRGELVSIQPNIARKVDRLEALIATSARMSGESALDTAIDLFVYVEKYRLFLAEGMAPGSLLPPDASPPLSDHDQNLDWLVDQLDLTPSGRSPEEIVPDVVDRFDRCWRRAEGQAPVEERFALAGRLSEAAGELLACVVDRDRPAVAQFLRTAPTG